MGRSRWSVIRLPLTALALGCALAALPASGAEPQKVDKMWVFIGGYTDGKNKGIHRFELDVPTGKLSGGTLAAEVKNPSFLAVHPSNRYLYAVTESNNFEGQKTGAIGALSLDPKTGELKLLNQKSSGGPGPCHVVVDKEGKNVLAANYSGGSCCVLPIGADGKLGDATSFVQHAGKSINKTRQEGPHAHSVNLDAANGYAFVADLGLDKVLVYKFDPVKGKLTANDPPSVELAPGAGPRHFAFHPSGKFAYAINELDSTLTAMTYDARGGVLAKIKSVTTLPKDAKGTNYPAEVVVHPSGKFVYGSNRGHDSIAIFTIDEKTGEPTPAGHMAKGIKTPRNFNIDPTGQYLIVANQDANNLVVFRIDQKTGQLEQVGEPVEVPKPVCIKFVPKAG